MPYIVATDTAFPPHYYTQAELQSAMEQAARRRCEASVAKVTRFFETVGVKGRYLSMPLDAYLQKPGFGKRNEVWCHVGLSLSKQAVGSVLRVAGMAPRDVSLMASTTVTGIAVPSIEGRLMNRLDLPADMKRVPLFGLGCVAGAAGLARVADYLVGHPREAALLLSVELCSLTLQLDDWSTANVIATALFGDGVAAVLMVGDEHPLAGAAPARILDSRSTFFPDTEDVMGWQIVDEGFQLVLSSGVPQIARAILPPSVHGLLASHGLRTEDVDAWVVHPGGPAIMDAVQEGLGLSPDALAVSRASLSRVGNLSSASVLSILGETLRRKAPAGAPGVLLAMGPGFCAEMLLLSC